MLFLLPLRAALILYHIQNCLSSTFFKFFQKFFLCCSLLRDSFNIISLSFLFVKYFFKFFSKSFLWSAPLSFAATWLLYHFFFSLSSPFWKVFSARLCLPPGMDFTYFFSSLFALSKVKVIFPHSLPRSPALDSNVIIYLFLDFVK